LLVSRETSASADRRHRAARRRDKLPALAVAPCNLRLEGPAPEGAARRYRCAVAARGDRRATIGKCV